MTQERIDRHNEIYQEAWRLAGNEFLAGEDGPRRQSQPGWLVRRRLRRAAKGFHAALELNPGNWSAMWALGKIHQRLGELSEALVWFGRAFAINPSQPNVAREAGITATEVGLGPEAVRYSRAAIVADPTDSGLVANLALALLINGALGEAEQTAREACSRAPQDSISLAVLRLVTEVKAGTRPVPTSSRGLDL
jgi:Flp pilus assembly protein TadD